jgi:hypothetical protein
MEVQRWHVDHIFSMALEADPKTPNKMRIDLNLR